MNIDIITQYVLAIVPAFTAIVGMVVTLGVGIGKIKKANKETTTTVLEVSEDTRELKSELNNLVKQNKELKKENLELKNSLDKVVAKMEHLYYIEKDYIKEIKE